MGTKNSAFAVIAALAVFMLAGLWMTYDLAKSKVDASAIAIISGLTGTALGAIGGMLAKTEKDPDPSKVTTTSTPVQ